MAVAFQSGGASRPIVQLSAYLLRETISDPIDALNVASRPGGDDGMVELDSGAAAGTVPGARALLAANKEKAPPWASALSAEFPDVGTIRNTSSRLVIFLPVESRWFALCFGYGNASLRWGAVEPNFGLQFAARKLNSDDLMEFGSRRIDASARTQVVQTPSGASLADLDVPLLGEFVRKLSGKLDEGASIDVDGVSTIVATDGISFKMQSELASIARVLGKMLDVVSASRSKPEFEFIDALEPLRASDDRVDDLEDELASTLAELIVGGAPSAALIGVAPPEDYSLDSLHQVRMTVGSDQYVLEDFSLDSVVDSLRASGRRISRNSLSTIRMSLVDVSGNAGQSSPLRAWLIFETERAQERYILTIGRWFVLAVPFATRLDADLAALNDLTSVLGLPDWDTTVEPHEFDYNQKASRPPGSFALVDHKTFMSDGSPIEPCDLLSAFGHLIHVKRWDQSATLSHLFAQGLVSLSVLNRDPSFASDFSSFVATSAPHCVAGLAAVPRHVVYAIGMKGSRTLPGSLPTFSKVNLRDYIQRVKGSGADVSIARIQMF